MHRADRELVESFLMPAGALITIRCGEPALFPLMEKPQSVVNEYLKMAGKSDDWTCRFHDSEQSACTIHDRRPFACKALQCWAPEQALNLIGKDLLTRFDFLPEDSSFRDLVMTHEREAPCPNLLELAEGLKDTDTRETIIRQLTLLVNKDLSFRQQGARQYRLSLAQELFFFGRPLFQVIRPLGLHPIETPQGISLRF